MVPPCHQSCRDRLVGDMEVGGGGGGATLCVSRRDGG